MATCFQLETVQRGNWPDFLAGGNVALLFGFLSCDPCRHFYEALSELANPSFDTWRFGYCVLTEKLARELLSDGTLRQLPTLIVKSKAGDEARLFTVGKSKADLQADVLRVISAFDSAQK